MGAYSEGKALEGQKTKKEGVGVVPGRRAECWEGGDGEMGDGSIQYAQPSCPICLAQQSLSYNCLQAVGHIKNVSDLM